MSNRTTEACDAAFLSFAKREMPWLLDKPEDDSERLMRTTASIAFGCGYQAGQMARDGLEPKDAEAAADPRFSCRAALEPQLVHQICGLRRHQVEAAVAGLLDYIDASVDLAIEAGKTQ